MFVGHGLLAFALVAGGAYRLGYARDRALALGVSAGLFATVPDVDVIYAPVGTLGASGALDAAEGFWSASTILHRAATHSLPVAAVAAIAFWCWSEGRRRTDGWRQGSLGRATALALLVGLVAVAGFVSGPLGAVVMGAFALAGLAVTVLSERSGDLTPRAVFATALVGLASHPFGDLLTGEPPAMVYPFDVTLVSERIALSGDPTMHLLGAFWVELATVWLAVFVYCSLTDRPLKHHLHGRAALGVAYAAAALSVPAPTLDSSYQFVFSVLAVGILGPAPLVRGQGWRMASNGHDGSRVGRAVDGESALAGVLTGLAAVTLASLAYAAVYVSF